MAVLSGVILMGSILLTFTENGYTLALLPSASATITALHGATILANEGFESQLTPPSNTFVLPTPTRTLTPNPACLPPEGYVAYFVKPGDTLQDLAAQRHITVDRLVEANCFDSSDLTTGSLATVKVIYLPGPAPTQGFSYPTKYPSVTFPPNVTSRPTATQPPLQEAKESQPTPTSLSVTLPTHTLVSEPTAIQPVVSESP